jgi:hypothetical protein
VRLLPVAARDEALREFLETRRYINPATGDEYAPTEPPYVHVGGDQRRRATSRLPDQRR